MSRYLGVDYGTRRVGLSISDSLGLIARPLDVVPVRGLLERLSELIDEHEIDTVVVGLPTSLGGGEGASAVAAREMAGEIADRLRVTVELVDERFTTKIADSTLLESGMGRRERKETVDKVAAAIILQTYLDRKKASPTVGNSEHEADVEEPE